MYKFLLSAMFATFVLSACTNDTTDDVNRCLPPVMVDNPNNI